MKRIILAVIFFVISGSLAPLSFSRAVAAGITPNDPLVGRQRYLEQIGAQGAWSVTIGSPSVVVAVLDSGLDMNHPDIQDALWTNIAEIPGDGIDNDGNGYVDDIRGWDFINDIPDPNPKFGGDFLYAGIHHGTLIAGIIAARGNNGLGIAGISWKSRIMPLRVLTNQGEGNVFDVARAIDYAIQKKATIINLSFLGTDESGYLRGAIHRAIDAGIVVIAAAGNNEAGKRGFNLDASPVFPACFNNSLDGVIAVGSIDALGQKVPFSNFGTCIDVVAPGQDLYATQAVNYERFGFDHFYGGGWSGTSLSTAMVTGVVALMKAANPSLSPSDIAGLFRKNCDSVDALNPSYKGKLGCGQLNAAKLVRSALDTREPHNSGAGAAITIAGADGTVPVSFFDQRGVSIKDRKPFFPFAPFRVPYTIGTSFQSGLTVVAAGAGGGPHVRVFNREGALVSQFFAYDKRWRIGAVAAIGDIDGDGEEEIVTAPASRGGAHVKIFSLSGIFKKSFFAYSKDMRTGYTLALGDINNDGKKDIVISAAGGAAGGSVKVFSWEGRLLTQFVAYPNSAIDELALAIGDVNGDQEEEIVVAPARGRAPLAIFSKAGVLMHAAFPYGQGYERGMSLAIGDVGGNGRNEIVAVPRTRAPAHVQILDGSGKTVGTFFTSSPDVRTGFIITLVP
ncbi:S8 family serine peptidase [Candidatus Uhrbacteria bacterium]|nr:S8 family serine peptidase [Candidatus Uhrbacteria bacterium]